MSLLALVIIATWRIAKGYDDSAALIVAFIAGGTIAAAYEIAFWAHILARV
jgi:hypothetical protein